MDKSTGPPSLNTYRSCLALEDHTMKLSTVFALILLSEEVWNSRLDFCALFISALGDPHSVTLHGLTLELLPKCFHLQLITVYCEISRKGEISQTDPLEQWPPTAAPCSNLVNSLKRQRQTEKCNKNIWTERLRGSLFRVYCPIIITLSLSINGAFTGVQVTCALCAITDAVVYVAFKWGGP